MGVCVCVRESGCESDYKSEGVYEGECESVYRMPTCKSLPEGEY